MTREARVLGQLRGRTALRPGLGTAAPSPEPALYRLVEDVDEFARDIWGKATSVARQVHDLSELLDTSAVLALIADGGMRLPDVRMMKDGEPVPTENFSRPAQLGRAVTEGLVDADAVARLISEGATVILQGLRRYFAPVDAFCRRLDTELGQITQAGAFLTPRDSVGAPYHYDYFDAFVCQIEGRKHWRHGDPPARVPRAAWQHGTQELDGRHRVDLHPGDCLYLPRGTYHEARTDAQASLHLTIRVVQPYTYRTLLEAILEILAVDDLDRALPVAHSDMTDQSLLDSLQVVVPGLADIAPPTRLLDALDAARAALGADFSEEDGREASGLRKLNSALRRPDIDEGGRA